MGTCVCHPETNVLPHPALLFPMGHSNIALAHPRHKKTTYMLITQAKGVLPHPQRTYGKFTSGFGTELIPQLQPRRFTQLMPPVQMSRAGTFPSPLIPLPRESSFMKIRTITAPLLPGLWVCTACRSASNEGHKEAIRESERDILTVL